MSYNCLELTTKELPYTVGSQQIVLLSDFSNIPVGKLTCIDGVFG